MFGFRVKRCGTCPVHSIRFLGDAVTVRFFVSRYRIRDLAAQATDKTTAGKSKATCYVAEKISSDHESLPTSCPRDVNEAFDNPP